MTQKEILENLTGEKFPEATPQESTRLQLEKTPFWIIGKENNYNIILGKWKLNKEPINFEEELQKDDTTPLNDYEKQMIAMEWLDQNLYNNILSMILAITTDILNNQNKQ